MTTIYFVRHVQATGNINRIFQGQINTEVSQQGYIQIENLKEYFSEVHLDRIYVSPLIRTMATAQAVRDGRDIPMVEMDDLKEINAGVWEGVPLTQIEEEYPNQLAVWRDELWNFRVDGSESGREVYERTGRALREILTLEKDTTIAVVSHGCALKNMLSYATGLSAEQVGETGWLANGSVTKMEFDGSVPGRLIFYNDCSHIDPDTILGAMNILKEKEK